MTKGQHVNLDARHAIGPTRHLKKWPLVSNNAEKHASWVQFRHVYPRNSRWWIFCFHEQLSKSPVHHSCIWWNSVLQKLKRPRAGKLVPSLVRVFKHLDMFPKSSETDWNHLKSAVSVHFRHSVFHKCQMPNTNPAHPRPDLVHICLTSPSTWGISPTVEVSAPEGSRGPLQGTRLFHEAPGEVDIPTLLESWLVSRWTFPASELQVVD